MKSFYLDGNLTIGTIRTQKSVTFAFPLKNEIQLKKTWSAAKTSFFSKVITLMTNKKIRQCIITLQSNRRRFALMFTRHPMLTFLSFLSFPTEIRISLGKIQEIKTESLGSWFQLLRCKIRSYGRVHSLTSLKQFHLIDGEAT